MIWKREKKINTITFVTLKVQYFTQMHFDQVYNLMVITGWVSTNKRPEFNAWRQINRVNGFNLPIKNFFPLCI